MKGTVEFARFNGWGEAPAEPKSFRGLMRFQDGDSVQKIRARQEPGPTGKGILLAFLCLSAAFCGCSPSIAPDALIVTQSPRGTHKEPCDIVDNLYPSGSRIILARGVTGNNNIRLLSPGLFAAGGAVTSYDGKRIVFAAKAQPKDHWQIYEASLDGVRLKRLTSLPGGCMDPALLPDGNLLFVSPVQKAFGTKCLNCGPSLYVQKPGTPPHQLTFGNIGVSNPTVLADGRILFVGSTPNAISNGPPRLALYTVNSDGTEISTFAGQHDKPTTIHRPRELGDGRIVFLTSDSVTSSIGTPEFVSSAAPFRGRKPLLANSTLVRSVEPGLNSKLLVCGLSSEPTGDSSHRCSLFSVEPEGGSLGTPILHHLEWDEIEAIPAVSIRRPMGRLSNVDLGKKTGQILCLNANQTSYGSSKRFHELRAARVRIFTEISREQRLDLGEVELQADGSFMAEVPANVPLGFEALDDHGNVIRRDPPLVWVRPGENRSCIGCHEPHNYAPRNLRPMAVRVPVPRLVGTGSVALAENQR